MIHFALGPRPLVAMGGSKRSVATNAASKSLLAELGINVPHLGDIQRSSTMGSLWAGYGRILHLENDEGDSYIAKIVEPPEGSGVSHNRKLKSYQVEAVFYTKAAPSLLRNDTAKIAWPHFVKDSLVSVKPGRHAMVLVLSDLREEFPSRHSNFNLPHAKAALSWLAAFHAAFWLPTTPRVEGVWEEGTYWHLATRLEEWEDMGGEWKQLKDAAHSIADELKTGPSTLLHGDPKSANFLFDDETEGGPVCAAYDFQYTGYGEPMKDVVYLLTSSVSSCVLGQHEWVLLEHYHTELTSRLAQRDPEAAAGYSLDVMQQRFDLAMADYVRFMAGWGFWGASSWAQQKARKYLKERGA